MDTTSNQSITTYCPSSPADPSSWDVFLSFRGEDVRQSFISHLYFALDQAAVSTYKDDPALEKGERISLSLLNAIKDSKMFVVVVSENYAGSSWCLDELAEILSCKKTKNQVLPVFYYVNPSDLRHLTGRFGEALEKHKKRNCPIDTIEKWKFALAEIAQLSGYHLKKDTKENESDIVQQIVERVTSMAYTKVIHLQDDPVGIDSAVEEIYQLLQVKSNDVRAIGICGMGGIGKTTTAKVFYNKYSNIFDISCFIENVKQYSQGGSPLLPLLQQILSQLHKKKNYKVSDVQNGIRQLECCIRSNKVLIILDGVDQSSHLEWLVMLCRMFSPGSRIVIATRDVYLLSKLKINNLKVDIYMVKKLEEKDSMELFSYHAFAKPMPPESFRELSLSFVTYAGGLPLALKVLGASLWDRPEMWFWKEKLEKVKKIPENDILKILRLSYDELSDETEKTIFLDIVFFFIEKDKDEAVLIFRSCDLFPDIGIPRLKDKCLLTLDKYNKFQMHSLIQEMGREVSKEESKHGKCRHLDLSKENECQALQKLEDANKIEVLILNLSMWKKKYASTRLFEWLPNLRLLEIVGALDIRGSFANLLQELRCIRWYHCPWTYLPPDFHPQKLVSIDMPFNEFKALWKSTKSIKQSWMSLISINMSYSRKMKCTPNFEGLHMVEKLSFQGCESLQKMHSSIGMLCNLRALNLSGCYHLQALTEHIRQLTNLGSLNLANCKDLKRLPDQLGDMKGLKMLDASNTEIEQLPDSIGQLKALGKLSLRNCKKLRKLPDQFGNMEALQEFSAGDSGIEELPESIGRLINLANLELNDCRNLKSLPDSICKLKLLKVLLLSYCSKLEKLPEQLGEMHSLSWLDANGTAIQELPDSIERLSRLQNLCFDSCKKHKYVPNSIWNLTSLVRLYLPTENVLTSMPPVTVNYMNKLESLSFRCNIRLWLPTILSFSALTSLCLSDDGKSLPSSTKWFTLSELSNLEGLTLDNWVSSFPELPPNLSYLSLLNHETLEELPDLSYLEQLKGLCIRNCISLQSLPPLPLNLATLDVGKCTSKQLFKPPLPLNLEELSVGICASLKDVPDLSMLKRLYKLSFIECSNLKTIDLKQSCLEVCYSQSYLLQVIQSPDSFSYYPSFTAELPNREIAEWFDYKSTGSTISFNIPSVLEDDFLGIALWVVFRNKSYGFIRAVIENKTEGIKQNYMIRVQTCNDIVDERVHSKVDCISRHEISMKSGDRLQVSFGKSLYSSRSIYDGQNKETRGGELKVVKCGAHVILKKHAALHDKVSAHQEI